MDRRFFLQAVEVHMTISVFYPEFPVELHAPATEHFIHNTWPTISIQQVDDGVRETLAKTTNK